MMIFIREDLIFVIIVSIHMIKLYLKKKHKKNLEDKKHKLLQQLISMGVDEQLSLTALCECNYDLNLAIQFIIKYNNQRKAQLQKQSDEQKTENNCDNVEECEMVKLLTVLLNEDENILKILNTDIITRNCNDNEN
eukprot:220208_1